MLNVLSVLLLAGLLIGCDALRLGPYTSPAVTGRVLAADCREPLPNVEVRRGAPNPKRAALPPKGAELLLEKPAIRTRADGAFAFASERALTVFRPAGWSLVQLSFQRSGYQPFQTNFPPSHALTNDPSGDPLLDVGVILLKPAHGHGP